MVVTTVRQLLTFGSAFIFVAAGLQAGGLLLISGFDSPKQPLALVEIALDGVNKRTVALG